MAIAMRKDKVEDIKKNLTMTMTVWSNDEIRALMTLFVKKR